MNDEEENVSVFCPLNRDYRCNDFCDWFDKNRKDCKIPLALMNMAYEGIAVEKL
jgi:hypothetical protein